MISSEHPPPFSKPLSPNSSPTAFEVDAQVAARVRAKETVKTSADVHKAKAHTAMLAQHLASAEQRVGWRVWVQVPSAEVILAFHDEVVMDSSRD